AYLRSVPPVANKVPGPVYKLAVSGQVFPGAEKPMSASDLEDKSKRGFYLATIAHCMECHTPFAPSGAGVDFQGSLRKGGREFPGPWGVSRARRARVRALAIGATPRSSAPSPKGCARTAAS